MKRKIIAGSVVIAAALGYFFWPKPAHKPYRAVTRTHAVWFVNPSIGKDTSTLVFRVENDTFVKMITRIDVESGDTTWKRSWRRDTVYYVPVLQTRYDSVAKKQKDTTIFHQLDNRFIIRDDDKHY